MSAVEPSSVRAGHADREKVVGRLNSAFAEGRLDVGELEERVAAAYAAKTLGELVPLTADLPVPHQPAPVTPTRRDAIPARTTGTEGKPWVPVGGMVGVFLLNVLIWAVISVASDDAPYFWPIWLLIPVFLTVLGAVGRRYGGGSGGPR